MTDPDIKRIGGEPHLSGDLLAMLCGVSPEEVRAEFDRQKADRSKGEQFGFRIPQAWVRGAKEIQARLGTNDFGQIVTRLRAEAGR